MDYSSVFELMSELTEKQGVSCVLVGGFAINCYKVTRQTVDVDYLITKEEFDEIRPFLKKAGYHENFTEEAFIRLNNKKAMFMDLDFVLVDKETLDQIIKSGKKIKIADYEFTIPSLRHIIALKLHAIKNDPKARKFKDLPDIINLIKANKIDCKEVDFHELCLKYGNKTIYNEIIKAL